MLKTLKTELITDFNKGPIYRSLYSNGAVLLEHKAVGFVGAKVNLNYLAGAIFENEEQEGLSHLIEHLLFKDNDSSLISQLELAGAEVNAYTYKENVCFEMTCLASKLDKLLPVFLEFFLQLKFTDEQFRKEKKVIIQELKEDKDDHEAEGLEYLFEKNFNRKLGHRIGGRISQVEKYKKEDILKYYKKFYTPDRMVLTIVHGDEEFSGEKIFFDKLQGYSSLKDKDPYRLKAFDKITKLKHVNKTYYRKVESTIQYFSFNGPALNYKNFYAYVILDEILFEGLSSVLFKKFREEVPLVYGLGSIVNSFSSCGNYIMYFNTQKKNVDAIKRGVIETLEECSNSLEHMADIEQIKERLIDSWHLAFDSIDERAEYLADNEIYQLNELDIDMIQEKIFMVDVKSVQSVAKQLYINDYSKLTITRKDK